MNETVRRIGIIGAWLLMALLVLGTVAAFWFFMIVTGLSGGDGTMAAAAGGCFILVVVEIIGMRHMFRSRGRYSQPERLP